MNDMAKVIVPKSDQLNSDDLISGPITVTITEVKIRGGQEQPISIHYDGDNGKPYKACKSMCRVMVTAWGADSAKYAGRSMTLYRDPTVKWAGMEVGGIRISHMSHIDAKLTMALTMTKGSRKPYIVNPMEAGTTKSPAQVPVSASAGSGSDEPAVNPASGDLITADEAIKLDARCSENGIDVEKLKKAAKVERLSMIKQADLPRAHAWIDAIITNRAEKK